MAAKSINELITSVLSGEATKEERQKLEDWISQSPKNAAEFKYLSALHTHPAPIGQVNVKEAWMKVKESTINKKETTNSKKEERKFIPNYRWISYAAILAIVVASGFYFFRQTPTEQTEQMSVVMLVLGNGEKIALDDESFSVDEKGVVINNNNKDNLLSYQNRNIAEVEANEQPNHLLTPLGKTYRVELSDGTRITLNALSKLIYPNKFGKGNREVTLKGEGFFEVAKDALRPFIVHTDQLSVQVLGTVFNVSSYASDETTRTTLVEGSVKVSRGKDSRTITPSQQYVYNKITDRQEINIVNTTEYTSWLKHEYIFQNATLEEILSRLQLWHSITINYANETVKKSRFSLRVTQNTPLDQIIELINYTNVVNIEKVNHNSINVKNQ